MNNSSTRNLLNKILADADNMTLAELETIKREMKYTSVGSDYDHNYSPVPSYWAEINQGETSDQLLNINIWAKYDIIDQEQFDMWNVFIIRINELSDEVWRRAHAHKNR